MNSVSFEPTKTLGRTKKALDGSGIDPIEERLEGTGRVESMEIWYLTCNTWKEEIFKEDSKK